MEPELIGSSLLNLTLQRLEMAAEGTIHVVMQVSKVSRMLVAVGLLHNALVIREKILEDLGGFGILRIRFSPFLVKHVVPIWLLRRRAKELDEMVVDKLVQRSQGALLIELVRLSSKVQVKGEGGMCRAHVARRDLEVLDELETHGGSKAIISSRRLVGLLCDAGGLCGG